MKRKERKPKLTPESVAAKYFSLQEVEQTSRVMETPPDWGGSAAIQSLVKQFVAPAFVERMAVGGLINTVLNGLPFSELVALRELLGLPLDQLAENLGISRATLHRRKLAGRLEQGESDRVVRYARLVGKAVEVLGSVAQARQWLRFPQFGLGNATPLDYARTEIGAREVENLLGRIDHGVYS